MERRKLWGIVKSCLFKQKIVNTGYLCFVFFPRNGFLKGLVFLQVFSVKACVVHLGFPGVLLKRCSCVCLTFLYVVKMQRNDFFFLPKVNLLLLCSSFSACDFGLLVLLLLAAVQVRYLCVECRLSGRPRTRLVPGLAWGGGTKERRE